MPHTMALLPRPLSIRAQTVRTVFVDTGAWIALAVRQDQLHPSAAAHARRLARALTPLLTTNYVMLETYTYIRYHYDHQKALAFDTILQNLIRRAVSRWYG